MDKIKLEFKAPSTKKLQYQGTEFEVKPFLSISEQIVLIQNYILNFFGERNTYIPEGRYDILKAEYNLIHGVIEMTTNLDIVSLDTDMYDATDLWSNIRATIVNYPQFRERLDRFVADIREEDAINRSVGEVIRKAADTLIRTLEKYSEFTPEELEKAKNSGLELLKGLESSPLSQVLVAPKAPTRKRTTK